MAKQRTPKPPMKKPKPGKLRKRDLSRLKELIGDISLRDVKRGKPFPPEVAEAVYSAAPAWQEENPDVPANLCITLACQALWEMVDA